MPLEPYTGIGTKGILIISHLTISHPPSRTYFNMAYQREFVARQHKMTGRPEL